MKVPAKSNDAGTDIQLGRVTLQKRHSGQKMRNIDPVVFQELPVIQKIIADETWLEGERRGAYVSPEDPVVQEHVCDVVLSIGEKLREFIQGRMEPQPCPIIVTDHSQAA